MLRDFAKIAAAQTILRKVSKGLPVKRLLAGGAIAAGVTALPEAYDKADKINDSFYR